MQKPRAIGAFCFVECSFRVVIPVLVGFHFCLSSRPRAGTDSHEFPAFFLWITSAAMLTAISSGVLL